MFGELQLNCLLYIRLSLHKFVTLSKNNFLGPFFYARTANAMLVKLSGLDKVYF